MSQISPYSVPDLKSTTDDALPNYLASLKFVQDHSYTDVRLALGYVAVAIAGALFYVDFKLGWDVTKPYTLPAVVVYFLLNGAFTYWIFYVEKGAVFVGKRDGTKITLISSTPGKYDPTYHLTVTTQTSSTSGSSSSSNNSVSESKISAPFTRWFTSDGFFVAKPFQQWLASNIPAIGKIDASNVVEDIGRGSGIEGNNSNSNSSNASGGGGGGGGTAKSANVRLGDLNDVLGYIQNQGAAATGSSSSNSMPGGKQGKRRH